MIARAASTITVSDSNGSSLLHSCASRVLNSFIRLNGTDPIHECRSLHAGRGSRLIVVEDARRSESHTVVSRLFIIMGIASVENHIQRSAPGSRRQSWPGFFKAQTGGLAEFSTYPDEQLLKTQDASARQITVCPHNSSSSSSSSPSSPSAAIHVMLFVQPRLPRLKLSIAAHDTRIAPSA